MTVTVESNNPPTISGTPLTSATTGGDYSFTPTASDSDNDTLTFSISGKPGWAGFDSTTGELSGTPTVAGVSSDIIISVSDQSDSNALAAFSITVSSAVPTKSILFIHTDILGTPVAETDTNGVGQ